MRAPFVLNIDPLRSFHTFYFIACKWDSLLLIHPVFERNSLVDLAQDGISDKFFVFTQEK